MKNSYAAECDPLHLGRQPTRLLQWSLVMIVTGLVMLILSFMPALSLPLPRPADPTSGTLQLRDGDVSTEATRLGIDIDVTVSGPTLRSRVTQAFRNPTRHWVSATYVYPLPSGGAVDTLKMVVGNRVIIADIKERGQARQIYEEAARSGQKAALTEQERPNIFTNSLANIGPGETVLVQIEYQEPVQQNADQYSLRLPLVVGPRYNPPASDTDHEPQSVALNPEGPAASHSDPVPDRDRISSMVLDPRVSPPINPTTITIRLNPGFPLGEVKSHHHDVRIDSPDELTRIITLADGSVPADRDFELTWKPVAAKLPEVGLFREHVGASDYVLAFVTPPPVEQRERQVQPREVIFVIDNSGSMGGTSIEQAKASLLYALGRLHPDDRFNVIRFDNTLEVLFENSVPADASHVSRATSFVAALQANGGTEMVPAMRAALTDHLADTGLVRQVVFLTDGDIGNEQQLFETITAMHGRSRIFMVGIGAAPNTYLMTRAAELGRGAFTHIGSVAQVEERMRDLFAKLENPAVTGVAVRGQGTSADIAPKIMPDIYRNDPLVITAKLDSTAGSLEITGQVGDQPWQVTLPLSDAVEGKGLSKLWASRRIADAEVARATHEITSEAADKTILALALEHQLVTRLTSLVAIDKTPVRPEGERLKQTAIPINLPAGWDFDKLFGEQPRQTPDEIRERHANAEPAQPQTASIQLPQSATSAGFQLVAGLALLALSLMLFLFARNLNRTLQHRL